MWVEVLARDPSSLYNKSTAQARARTQCYTQSRAREGGCVRNGSELPTASLESTENSRECDLSRASARRTSRRWSSRGRTAPRAMAAAAARDPHLMRTHLGFPRYATDTTQRRHTNTLWNTVLIRTTYLCRELRETFIVSQGGGRGWWAGWAARRADERGGLVAGGGRLRIG
jgi:hypothetical protein